MRTTYLLKPTKTYILQEIARKRFRPGTLVYRLMHGKNLQRNVSKHFSFNHWQECGKAEKCDCTFILEGVSPKTQGYRIEAPAFERGGFRSKRERVRTLLDDLDYRFRLSPTGDIVPVPSQSYIPFIENKLALSQNCQIYRSPIQYRSGPEALVLPALRRDVDILLQKADLYYFGTMERVVDSYTCRPFPVPSKWLQVAKQPKKLYEIPTLAQLCYEAASPYCLIKRGLAVSATANLYDNGGDKLKRMSTSYCRPIRGLKPKTKEILHLFPDAVDITVQKCGGEAEVGKHSINMDLGKIVPEMYLGTAGGVNATHHPKPEEHCEVWGDRNPNGKKYEILEAAMRRFVAFYSKGTRPYTTFKNSEKQEVLFAKDLADKVVKEAKARNFVIPNLETILLEHTIGFIRKLEVGGAIGIGHSWSRGGMDALLKKMGVFDDYESYVLNEGDLRNQDQSYADVLINLFFSSRLMYFDPKHPDYDKVKQTVKYLIEEFTQRVTHVVEAIWAIICGGVPSGALHTSHMDSWILVFLYVVFCLHAAEKHPHLQEQIVDALLSKLVTIYGDDTWYFVKKGPLAPILSAHQFAKFLEDYFDMVLKDIRVGHPLVSVPHNGYFKVEGGKFLRHYCVLNPVTGPGQPKFVPYRPMAEIVLKVVYGREPKPRDPVNMLLSALGHAYGTYGSNMEVYNWLRGLYHLIMTATWDGKKIDLSLIDRAEKDVLRKCRQVNITSDQLLSGFPTLDKLWSMNEYDDLYHSVATQSYRASTYARY